MSKNNKLILYFRNKNVNNTYKNNFVESPTFARSNAAKKQLTGKYVSDRVACEKCGRLFKNAESCRVHGYSCGQDLKIECGYCGMTYKTKGSYRNHVRKVHNINKSKPTEDQFLEDLKKMDLIKSD